MTDPRGIQTVPNGPWIPLDQALAWICFDAAFDLEMLTASFGPQMGLQGAKSKELYEAAWIELSFAAARDGMVIRGRRERARVREPLLSRLSEEDLFNCRFLDFVLYPEGMTILVSRFAGDFSGTWKAITIEQGWDFTDLVVARQDLIAFKARARPVRRKTSHANKLKALKHLKDRIAGIPIEDLRRDDLIEEMRGFGISRSAARENWKLAVLERPELGRPGRRKRAV